MVDLNKLASPTADLGQILKEAGDRAFTNLKKLKPEIPTTGAVAKELENAMLPKGSLVRTEAQDGFSRTISDIDLGKVREQTIRGDRAGETIRLTYSTEGDKKLVESRKINNITGEETVIFPPPPPEVNNFL